MDFNFPATVPEIPVTDIKAAIEYYKNSFGFSIDWGTEGGGIVGSVFNQVQDGFKLLYRITLSHQRHLDAGY